LSSNVNLEVANARECAGFCQTNPENCSVFVYDDQKSLCYLGSIGGNYSLIPKQQDTFGFFDAGKKKQSWPHYNTHATC